MKYFICSILLSASLASFAFADTKAELHIVPTGEVHFLGATLLRKHASNLYTVETWGFKWFTNIPYGTKMESAYGEPIKPEDIQGGDTIDVAGKLILQDSAYQIEASSIKDLSIKTGVPAPLPPAPPAVQPPTPAPAPMAISSPPKTPKGLTMALKKGYRGGQVTVLQKFLKKQGLMDNNSVSGVFGAGTEEALKKFQEANALEASGTAGPKTRAFINALLQ